MKLKQLLEQLNQLAKERPEALEMEVWIETNRENANFLISLGDEYEAQWTRIQKFGVKEMTENKDIFILG